MIDLYVVVAITAAGIESKFITPDSYDIKRGNLRVNDYNKRIRVYTTLGQARTYRTRLRKTKPSLKQGGADYSIFRLRISADGKPEAEWVE